MNDDALTPAETLRKKRADRRARRKAMLRRALRKARMMNFAPALAAHWACRAADNLTSCSCWLCRPCKGWRQQDWREKRQKVRDGDVW